MKAIHYFLFSLALFISGSVTAQQDTLRLNPHALDSLPSTTFVLNGTGAANNPSFGIWLYNVSNSTFSDTVSFAFAIDTSGVNSGTYVAPLSDSSGFTFTPQSVTILPHDSILLYSMQLHVFPPDFVIGSSVVVIWPIISHVGGLVLLDSASAQLTIQAPTGIGTIDAAAVKVYMSGQELLVKNNLINLFGGIRIYNVEGQILTEQRIYQSAEIPMSQYSPGIYMVELTLDNGQRAVYKVSNIPSR